MMRRVTGNFPQSKLKPENKVGQTEQFKLRRRHAHLRSACAVRGRDETGFDMEYSSTGLLEMPQGQTSVGESASDTQRNRTLLRRARAIKINRGVEVVW